MAEERANAAAERITERLMRTLPPGEEQDETVAFIKFLTEDVIEWDVRTGTRTVWVWPFPEYRS